MQTNEDRCHMRAALALASRSLGECWPNPAVGCVIVRNARVVGRGRTASTGRPHAETRALAMAGSAAQGATAYVTLEPCDHTGQTPPCSLSLINAGISRVVVAVGDPDPRVSGAGLARLQAAGLAVEVDVLRAEAATLNEGFFRRISSQRPLVTLKLATTLDGQIAAGTGESQWITGVPARRAAHALRATHDAILVGAGTVVSDDPRLTCRLPGARQRPLVRIVADSHLRTRSTSVLLATARQFPTWFLVQAGIDPARKRTFRDGGAELIACAPAAQGVDLTDALRHLAQRGITRLLVEGGSQLASAFLRENLVDTLAWFHAPGVIGADGFASVQGFGLDTLAHMPRFEAMEHRMIGLDTLTVLRRS